MRRGSGVALVAVTGVAACAAVAGADFVLPTPHPPGPNTLIATEAVNDATRAVADGDGACRVRFPTRRASETPDPPPQEMLDAFAVLRRAATPQDALDAKYRQHLGDKINVGYVRRARVLPDGASVYVIPALDARPAFPKRRASCFARERTALEHRLRGKPAQAQRAARRLLRDLQRGQREAAGLQPQPGLFVETFGRGGGGGGGGLDVATIRKHGEFNSLGLGRRGARVVGLVPDGVATIDFAFARGRAVGPRGTRVYRTVYRRTVAVVHNIVVLTVPRAPEDALFSRQVWRATDGSVVNTVRPPF
jgi:hypothetical protein